jgi:hypothetical protein
MLFVAHQQILSIQICFDPVFQDLVTWVLSYVRKARYDAIIMLYPRRYENILVWSGSIVLGHQYIYRNICHQQYIVLQYLQRTIYLLQYLRPSIHCIAISPVNNIFIAAINILYCNIFANQYIVFANQYIVLQYFGTTIYCIVNNILQYIVNTIYCCATLDSTTVDSAVPQRYPKSEAKVPRLPKQINQHEMRPRSSRFGVATRLVQQCFMIVPICLQS